MHNNNHGADFIDFEMPKLAIAVEAVNPDALNSLSFGAIRLNAAGRVMFYSDAERRLSGYKKPTIGHDFFVEIAPCMATGNFRGRIERALEKGNLNIRFEYIGDFSDSERTLTVRIQSASDGGYWIFMRREIEAG